MKIMSTGRRGFSLIEMLVVIAMIGMLLSIMAPKFRMSSTQRVNAAADQLVTDLELVRTRAITARAGTRLVITVATNRYTAFLDDDNNGTIGETAAETQALQSLQTRILTDNVVFGRGTAPQLPNFPGGGATTFATGRVNFESRGMTTPFGTKGVIYITSAINTNAVAAVTITAGAGIRRWVYRNGVWQ